MPVKPKTALARLAVMPFNDLVSIGKGTAGVISKWTWFGMTTKACRT